MADARPRVAATVRSGDIVHLDDGTTRIVQGTPSSAPGAIGGLMLTIRFRDGGSYRAGAGAELRVERPA
ncbi:hypothetical protein ABZ957_15300 [Streptomyces sp. NPDC046316]|uniref:hypothetical protein n=1 Tax=Streptomyces sp. NPDC046316 TaxID=3154494 RepID=UPI0034056088